MNIWKTYRENFPSRYLQPSAFDEALKEHIAKHDPWVAIDIGGGEAGTQALKPIKLVFHLDPFVECPAWMNPTTWDANHHGQLVVARGSANYLSDEEIAKIPDKLEPGGWFLANTFFNPPAIRVQNTQTLSGRAVTETVFTVASKQKLIHRLDFPDAPQEHPIIHSIRIIPEATWRRLLPGIIIEHRGSSATLKWQKI